MSEESRLFNQYQRPAIFSVALALLGLFSPFGVKAQVSWLVTITFTTANKDLPTYSVSRTPPTGGTCPYGVPDDGGYHLRICKNDTVTWTAATPSNQNSVRIFFEHAVLDANTGAKTHYFQTQNTAATTGGTVDTSVTPDDFEEYPYSIAVYDIQNTHLYLHEPKIIIGKGSSVSANEAVTFLERDLALLDKSIQGKPDAEVVQDDLKKMRGIVHNLKEHLHIQ
jgi:hypothetical protein